MKEFEIKGDTDSYQRLTMQLDSYLFACDCVYLVVHKKKIPEWLPREIGVIRVYDNGDAYIENYSHREDSLDISTMYDWEALFLSNNLGKSSKKTKQLLKVLESIRKNIMFNRFFAEYEEYGSKKFTKFYPFTIDEKSVIIGLDIPFHFRKAQRDIDEIEERIKMLRTLTKIGCEGIDVFMKGGLNDKKQRQKKL